MQIYSSVGKNLTSNKQISLYTDLDIEYRRTGFTYKSNEILHKVSENSLKIYPYEILLHTAKTFHFNQFEIIFLSHILTDMEPCYQTEPELFTEHLEVSPAVTYMLSSVATKYSGQSIPSRSFKSKPKKDFDSYEDEDNEENQDNEQPPIEYSVPELKKLYMYLLVLGYAVKYYLNQQTSLKPYDEEIKARHPNFFVGVFNVWAKKYGNSVLSTTPRRINSYYLSLAAQLDTEDNANQEIDCQYRNYNQIVEELIKATTEGDELQVEPAINEMY